MGLVRSVSDADELSGPARAPARERTPLLRTRRVVDVMVSAALIVVSSPLLLLGSLAVLLASGRPVFFGHRRVGRDGRPFRCWKLRTMEVGAEERLEGDPRLLEKHRENGYKLPTGDDPRVTRVGAWLRRSYLDELPQLFNVLSGSMTLVGPRPVVEEELEEWFGERAEELLAHRPGIFGAWVSLGAGRPPYPERVRVELEYLRTRSLRRDLEILRRSVAVVVRGEGGEDGEASTGAGP